MQYSKQLMSILLKLFRKIGSDQTLANSFNENIIPQTSNPYKYSKNKRIIDL